MTTDGTWRDALWLVGALVEHGLPKLAGDFALTLNDVQPPSEAARSVGRDFDGNLSDLYSVLLTLAYEGGATEGQLCLFLEILRAAERRAAVRDHHNYRNAHDWALISKMADAFRAERDQAEQRAARAEVA